jgi:hypothetical protein
MRFVLIGVTLLALSGCAAIPADMSALESPLAEPLSALTTPADIDTLADGINYARALTGSAPDLADEISATVDALGDLVAEAELPWDVHNDIGQRLLSLSSDVLRNPAGAEDHLPELHAIADDLAEAVQLHGFP